MERILLMLLIAQSLGFAVFGKFQAEAPWWQMFLKWMVIIAIAYTLFLFSGETITFVVFDALFALSLIVHVGWCRKNHIHPTQATPRKKYYELRDWEWKE